MYIFSIILVSLSLFLPWVGRTGTNVSVLVNSPCGPVVGEPFSVVFQPGGEAVAGVTDENGRWSYVGPVATEVRYYDNTVWFFHPVLDNSVNFHSWREACPGDVNECAAGVIPCGAHGE